MAVVRAQITSACAPSPVPAAAPTASPTPHATPSIAAIEASFAAAPECPHCRSTAVKRWGSANGLGRYRCKPCGVTFNALTDPPLARLHKRELWAAHSQTLVEGISLRKVAGRIGVDLTTAFRWRHRFLQAPKALKAKRLEGTVEADETYFLHSEKGARRLGRPARKRGGVARKRGLSDEQVPVVIARDRNAATTDESLGLRGASIYLAQSCQRLRGQHPRGQRLRDQRRSLGIRSHANPGSRSRANPSVGRNSTRCRSEVRSHSSHSDEVRSRRCGVHSRNRHSYEVQSSHSCWIPNPNRTPQPVCFQGQGGVLPPPRRRQVFVCASDHSYPTPRL